MVVGGQEDADIESRYERVVLPEPGGDAELQASSPQHRVAPLDFEEPLWRSILVDGYRGGSVVLFGATTPSRTASGWSR